VSYNCYLARFLLKHCYLLTICQRALNEKLQERRSLTQIRLIYTGKTGLVEHESSRLPPSYGLIPTWSADHLQESRTIEIACNVRGM